MPNPFNLSDAPNLTNKSIKRIHIKNMPHKSFYKTATKGQGKLHKALGEARKAGASTPQKGLPIIKGRSRS